MKDQDEWSARTLAAQALGRIDETTRAVVPPLHVATTYIRDPDNLYRSGNIYGRPDNETVREGEAIVAALEGAEAALLFGSGMSAAIALFLGLGPGAHVVAPKVMYWSLRNWLVNEAPAHGLTVDLADAEDLDALAAAIRPGRTKLVWLETPSNPLWGVSDIAGAARLAHAAGAKLAVEFDLRDAGLHPAAGARRRCRRCMRRPNISTAIPTSSPARWPSPPTIRRPPASARSGRRMAWSSGLSRPIC